MALTWIAVEALYSLPEAAHSRAPISIKQFLLSPAQGDLKNRLHWDGKLPAEKIDACEAISWWSWDSVDDRWMCDYEKN